MLEALWSVEFVSSEGLQGAGVAVFETERILGGDSTYTYIGSYKVIGDMVRAEIDVTHYSGEPLSVFGAERHFKLNLAGTPKHNSFDVVGIRVGAPEQQISIRLTRRAELP